MEKSKIVLIKKIMNTLKYNLQKHQIRICYTNIDKSNIVESCYLKYLNNCGVELNYLKTKHLSSIVKKVIRHLILSMISHSLL